MLIAGIYILILVLIFYGILVGRLITDVNNLNFLIHELIDKKNQKANFN